MSVRWTRAEEWVPDLHKANRRISREASRPTGTERAQTMLVAEEARSGVAHALSKAQAAIDAAADAVTTSSGKNSRRRGQTQPESPAGGWVQGDQWVVDNADGVPVEVRVWDGAQFVPEQLLASELLVLSGGLVRLADGTVTADSIAAGAVTAETLAVDALDAAIMRGAQIFGGYIESPVIASSDRLGSGANVLNDPGFSGTVNGSWVLSGHTGDAAVTQTDTITWDKSWTAQNLYPAGPVARRNWGNVVAQLRLTPAVRKTGSLIFANYAWLNATPRTITNPYPFPNESAWSSFTPTGGSFDPSFYEVDNRPPLAGVARTSYLTNTKVQPVVSGERWNVRLEFIKMAQARIAHIDSITVEIINNANSSVVWSRPLLADEIAGGLLNDWWDTTFTGNIRYRIKTVYKAAGGAISRRPNSGSFARWSVNGAEQSGWSANSISWLSYKSRPVESASDSSLLGSHSVDYQQRARQMELIATSAMFAKVEPVAGWRLSEDEGFELFNSLGARTGKIDGESNFLAGTFATREEGRRLQIKDEVIGWYADAPVPRSRINETVDGLRFTSPQIDFYTAKVAVNGRPLPYAMASGRVAMPTPIAHAAFVTATVTFPVGRFTQIPNVVTSTTSARCATQPDTRTDSSFRFGVANFSGAAAGPGTGDTDIWGQWVAIQMMEGGAIG